MLLKSQIQEFSGIATKLNYKKIRNAISVYQSFYQARKYGHLVHPAMPFAMSIEPTTSCNLRCPQCISGLRAFTRPRGMLSPETFSKTMDDLADYLIYLTLYFQGEPFLNQHFFDFVKIANEAGIYTNTSSNAHYLDEENCEKVIKSGLDRLIISMDGLDQESYEIYRIGGKLDAVTSGMKRLVEMKKKMASKTPFIDLQFIVMGHNEHQLSQVKDFGREMGVDRTLLKTVQVYDHEMGSDLLPENEEYSRYKQSDDGKFVIKNEYQNHCWKMWHSAVITWDGKVVPCCFDKDASHEMGNIMNKDFGTIWNSDAYKAFRGKLFKSRSEIEMCRNCTEGTKVWT